MRNLKHKLIYSSIIIVVLILAIAGFEYLRLNGIITEETEHTSNLVSSLCAVIIVGMIFDDGDYDYQ